MERNWERFTQGPVVKFSERMHASISPKGVIFLNRRAIAAIGAPDYVVLMYDNRRATIGIAAAAATSTGAFVLKRKDVRKSGGRSIYAKNFCRYHSIYPDTTLAFRTAEVDKDGVLTLCLHEVRSVSHVKAKISQK
ncbi:MAG: hypothetical protein LC734_09100 [Acidobacteria bacterium]|nr:hypothetical protein [Acidobacteriota bacterium]